MSSFGTNVSALTADDTFYNGNNILFYDPDYQGLQGCLAGGDDGAGTNTAPTVNLDGLDKNERVKAIFQGLIAGGMNAVQASAVLGNIYIESGRSFDPNVYEGGVDRPSSGYGIVQWTGPRRTNIENYAKQQGIAKSDLGLQIKFLLKEYNDSYKAQLAGTPFDAGTNVADATRSWMLIFERPLLVGNNPAQINERMAAGKKIYDTYKDTVTAQTPADDATATGEGCDATDGAGGDASGGGAVNGDILKTAEGYAWPGPRSGTAKSQARTSYQLAKPKYSPGTTWSDCGGFVATVMLSSGVDPNFPDHSVNAQARYMRSHPEKYRIIPLTSLAQVQPGDLIVENSTDHIEIVKNGATGIDASLGERIPSTRPTGIGWMLAQGSFIARYTGGK